MGVERKLFVCGDWKCNGTLATVSATLETMNNAAVPTSEYLECLIAPPTLHAYMLKEKLRKDFSIAAQNCWTKANGAYTGEISADMLQDMGIPWVILGHSERRQHNGETDEIVAEKVAYALTKGLKVVLCVGENMEQRMAHQHFESVIAQLNAIADKISRSDWNSNIVITYEPLWAVGPEALKVASAVQAQDMHAEIRKWVRSKASEEAGDKIRIIYGGSINKGNCEKMIKAKDIDGFMIGSASLRPPEFCEILTLSAVAKFGDMVPRRTSVQERSASIGGGGDNRGGGGIGAERRLFVCGDWKCNGTLSSVASCLEVFNKAKMVSSEYAEVVVAPPTLHAFMLKEKLRKDFAIAAQNCWAKPNGAYTGEVSADMLQDMGIPWVIVGHSERRSQCYETDEVVAEKANYALSKGLKVILCVGENLDIRMAQTQVAYVKNQLQVVAEKISRDSWKQMIITYEPLWAVGPDALKVASPVQTQDMHVEIRKLVANIAGDDAGKSIRIIYGGSVNKGNCEKMAKQKDIDGFMLGSASLRPVEFCEIINTSAVQKFGEGIAV